MDSKVEIIDACREQQQQHKTRNIALDCLTAELKAQTHAAVAESRELLERTQGQVEPHVPPSN